MVIVINNKYKKIKIKIPLFLIKTKLIQKKIINNTLIEESKIETIRNITPKIYKALKKYKKEHKRLNLIELINEDCQVLIQI